MPEIGSEGPGVHAIVDQLEPGGVAQQMRVNVAHANALGRSRQCLKEAIGANSKKIAPLSLAWKRVGSDRLRLCLRGWTSVVPRADSSLTVGE
jgi:hypothetical protein